MGHETVGHIVSLGDGAQQAGAEGLSEGQPVTVNPVISCGACESCRADAQQRCTSRRVIGVDPALRSAFAETMTVPAANIVLLPDGMPEEYGALIEPLAVGYHAAVRGACVPGDRVLVIGGGPIGQAAALGALRLGAERIVVSEPHAGRRALLGRLGLAALDSRACGRSAAGPRWPSTRWALRRRWRTRWTSPSWGRGSSWPACTTPGRRCRRTR